MGDELLILAPVDYFTKVISRFGEEVTPETSIEQFTESAQIVVINKEAIGKSVQELDIAEKYGVLLTRVTRMQIEIPRTAERQRRCDLDGSGFRCRCQGLCDGNRRAGIRNAA